MLSIAAIWADLFAREAHRAIRGDKNNMPRTLAQLRAALETLPKADADDLHDKGSCPKDLTRILAQIRSALEELPESDVHKVHDNAICAASAAYGEGCMVTGCKCACHDDPMCSCGHEKFSHEGETGGKCLEPDCHCQLFEIQVKP